MTADRLRSHTSVTLDGAAVEIAGVTDRGTVRTQNQDVWAIAPSPGGRSWVLLLADGMGGHRGGLESARAAVDAAVAEVSKHDDPATALPELVAAASRGVAGVRETVGGGPGTTLVIAVVAPAQVTVANVGDSRAYLLTGGEAAAITSDHSWTAEQVAAGRMTPDEARHDRRRNIITRAVLGDPVTPDLYTVRPAAGAMIVLCSDGFWEPLDDAQLAAAMAGPGALAERVERACDVALAAGSTDNVTLVAACTRPRGRAG